MAEWAYDAAGGDWLLALGLVLDLIDRGVVVVTDRGITFELEALAA